ncbi:MAG: pyridoxal 5'-phosphate synthase [Pseudomonadota bacterium]|nr:pyridoxal 5'-phosphate synthase [Pseudomonadota bacterium]
MKAKASDQLFIFNAFLRKPTTMNKKALPKVLPNNPMHIAKAWFDEACENRLQPNPNAMTLATINKNSSPSARIVLCKSFVPDPGYILLFTNYESDKGQEIKNNANSSVVFHWDHTGQQIRIKGISILSSTEESDAYFASRNIGSQLSAWGSNQSQPISSREALIEQMQKKAHEYGIDIKKGDIDGDQKTTSPISRPPHWGGIRIWASDIELWIHGEDRIHDRALWKRKLTPEDNSFSPSEWIGTRLQP